MAAESDLFLSPPVQALKLATPRGGVGWINLRRESLLHHMLDSDTELLTRIMTSHTVLHRVQIIPLDF